MLIVWPEVIFLLVVQCLCTWGCLSASKIPKLRAVCRLEQPLQLFSLPSPSRHYCSTHTTVKMLSAMRTVIRKQTTQGCYNRSMAGSEFHFALQRHWELRRPVKGIFSSHTSAPLCSLTRGQLLTDNMYSLMSLTWVEGRARRHCLDRSPCTAAARRGVSFFLLYSGRSLAETPLLDPFRHSAGYSWHHLKTYDLTDKMGNFSLEKDGLTDFHVSRYMPKKPLWSPCSQWDVFGIKQSPAGNWSWRVTWRALQVTQSSHGGTHTLAVSFKSQMLNYP